MLKLEGVAAFVGVVETGSISEAARRLGLSKSLVGDRLSELERTLGARLLHRTTRKTSLTEDGVAFLDRARRLLQESEAAMADIASRRGELAGSLRISGPATFGVQHLGPAIYAFLHDHPGIDIALELEDRLVDLGGGGYDGVIRHGPVHGKGLTAVRLATSRRRLVASEAYVEQHGEPRSLAELETHQAIIYANRPTDWRFEGPDGAVVVHPPTRLRVNNGQIMRDAATAGLGITLLPTFMLHGEMARRSLRTIDVGAQPESAELNFLFLKHPGASAKLEALIDHLRAAFGDPPYWDDLT